MKKTFNINRWYFNPARLNLNGDGKAVLENRNDHTTIRLSINKNDLPERPEIARELHPGEAEVILNALGLL